MPYSGRIKSLLLLALLAIAPVLGAQDDPAGAASSVRPSLIAQSCFSCHGKAGNSSDGAAPSIAGLPKGYIIAVMRAYRHGGRFSILMGRLATAYTEAEVMELADYFSRQSFSIHKQRVDWELAHLGGQLHRLYCKGCHGDRWIPPERDIPTLNGRWISYLRWTLRDYLLGISQSDEKMSERLIQVIRRHGMQGIEALIHYYGSARPADSNQE